MLKPMLAWLGIFVLVLGTVFFLVVSKSSQAEFVTLSDDAMGQLIGGAYTQSSTQNSAGGKHKKCSTASCPSGSEKFHIAYYGCPVCYSGQTIYTRETFDWEFYCSCGVSQMPAACPEIHTPRRTRKRCESATSSTC